MCSISVNLNVSSWAGWLAGVLDNGQARDADGWLVRVGGRVLWVRAEALVFLMKSSFFPWIWCTNGGGWWGQESEQAGCCYCYCYYCCCILGAVKKWSLEWDKFIVDVLLLGLLVLLQCSYDYISADDGALAVCKIGGRALNPKGLLAYPQVRLLQGTEHISQFSANCVKFTWNLNSATAGAASAALMVNAFSMAGADTVWKIHRKFKMIGYNVGSGTMLRVISWYLSEENG